MAGAGSLDAEQHVIAAAHHLILALEANNNLSDDVRKLLSDLNINLSEKVKLNSAEAGNLRDVESRLTAAHHTIVTAHSTHPRIWDAHPLAAQQYLQAVDEIQRSVSILETTPLHRGSRGKELFDGAQSILQIVMARLQNELTHILVQNNQCFGHAGLPADRASTGSYRSNEDNYESSSTEAEEDTSLDLIHPDVVPHIKAIATTMFASGYRQEFCHVFNVFWRDTLAEYLTILNVEHLSVEDVLQMEWTCLNSKIRSWRAAIKKITTTYLTGAKRLFHQILGEHSCVCLIEASKVPLLCMLNFGQAVAIGPHRPEHLFCLLDMYEALASVLLDVDALFPEGSGTFSRVEFHELSNKLGESAMVIFKEFRNYIALSLLGTSCTNGEIPHLTRYVVNYVLLIGEYLDTLESLLQTQNAPDCSERGQSSVGLHLQLMTASLVANLDDKSDFYRQLPLKHIFLMNNIHYMVHKIKNSKVHPHFGDHWIKSHTVKYRTHGTLYQRLAWCSTHDLFLEAEKATKSVLKQRCQEFASLFEDVYKNQTRWCVPDKPLREELRISVSKNLVLAYRNFVNAVNKKSIGEKHVKYSEHDLTTYILDLFEGTPKSLNHLRKR